MDIRKYLRSGRDEYHPVVRVNMRMKWRIAAQSWLGQGLHNPIVQALPASFVNPGCDLVITVQSLAIKNHRLPA